MLDENRKQHRSFRVSWIFLGRLREIKKMCGFNYFTDALEYSVKHLYSELNEKQRRGESTLITSEHVQLPAKKPKVVSPKKRVVL